MFEWNLKDKEMPALFELSGMRFFFYSLEHLPIMSILRMETEERR